MEFNVADLIERVARNVPDRTAVVCGERRATYRHFDETSSRFAQHLLSRGIGKGNPVAIYAYNSIEWIEAMFGCFKIGAVPININYRYVEEELAYILDDADIRCVVYDAEFSPRLASIRDRLPLLEYFVHFDHDAAASSDVAITESVPYSRACEIDTDLPYPERSGDDRYILYTGGTTGMPKGVVWRQADVLMAFGGGLDVFTQEPVGSPEEMADRCLAENATPLVSLQMAPLMHGAAQWGVMRALFEGATVVLLDKKSFDPHEAWRLIERERVNVLLVTGDAMAKPLMDALEEGDYDTTSLLAFASTSAVFSPSLKERYIEKLPHVVITEHIGASESGPAGSTICEKGAPQRDAGGPRVKPASETVVLDENLELIPPGDERVGWLAKGGYLPIGYHKDAEKTRKTFVTAANGKRYVLPGDMAKLHADGTITLLGRGSQCINTGGEKVYPEEVEGAVKSHPAVLDCLVTATPDERFGSRVTALVKIYDNAEQPDAEAIQQACEKYIARYKLPRRIYYVNDLKRSPSGKADYQWAKKEAMKRYSD